MNYIIGGTSMKNRWMLLLFFSALLVSCGFNDDTVSNAKSESTTVENVEAVKSEAETDTENEYLSIDYYKYYTVGAAEKTEENGYYADCKVTFSAVFFVDEYGDNRFAVQSEDGDVEECFFSDNESFLDLDRFSSGDGIQIYGKTLSNYSLYIELVEPISAPFVYPEESKNNSIRESTYSWGTSGGAVLKLTKDSDNQLHFSYTLESDSIEELATATPYVMIQCSTISNAKYSLSARHTGSKAMFVYSDALMQGVEEDGTAGKIGSVPEWFNQASENDAITDSLDDIWEDFTQK